METELTECESPRLVQRRQGFNGNSPPGVPDSVPAPPQTTASSVSSLSGLALEWYRNMDGRVGSEGRQRYKNPLNNTQEKTYAVAVPLKYVYILQRTF
jgi:hypothetical protein